MMCSQSEGYMLIINFYKASASTSLLNPMTPQVQHVVQSACQLIVVHFITCQEQIANTVIGTVCFEFRSNPNQYQ